MPIFMDRHKIKGITPLDLAQAHYQDLLKQDKHDVKMMTYWFDEKRGTVFCLYEAEDPDKVVALHEDAHGEVPHEIIEVETSDVGAFLGRIQDPIENVSVDNFMDTIDEYAGAIDSAFRVIMFTDLKDSTVMTTQLGEEKAMELLRKHNSLTRNALNEHNGREVKHTGDGFMIAFTRVTDALSCACAVQKAFDAYNKENSDDAMYVRIGLSAGEPVQEHGDFFGTTVILASRICDHANPEKILLSHHVHENCEDHSHFSFSDLGTAELKGFDEKVQVYGVDW